MISLKSAREIEIMRRANVIVAEVLQELKKRVAPGVTTLELDAIAEEFTLKKTRFPPLKDITWRVGFIPVVCAPRSMMKLFTGFPRTERFAKAILSV